MIKEINELEFFKNVVQLKLKERYPDYWRKINDEIKKLKQELKDCQDNREQEIWTFQLSDDDCDFVLYYNYKPSEKKLTITDIVEDVVKITKEKSFEQDLKHIEKISKTYPS